VRRRPAKIIRKSAAFSPPCFARPALEMALGYMLLAKINYYNLFTILPTGLSRYCPLAFPDIAHWPFTILPTGLS